MLRGTNPFHEPLHGRSGAAGGGSSAGFIHSKGAVQSTVSLLARTSIRGRDTRSPGAVLLMFCTALGVSADQRQSQTVLGLWTTGVDTEVGKATS